MDRELIVEALKRLLAHEPADDAVYMDRTAPGGVSWPWPTRLEVLVDAQGSRRPRILLHGPIGTGKTTELRRWERVLRAAGREVVYLAISPPELGGPLDLGWLAGVAFQAAHPGQSDNGRGLPWFQSWRGILLVDGLDLTPERHARSLFGPSTRLVEPIVPAVVYVAPHALLTDDPKNDRDHRFDDWAYVSPFPVIGEDLKPDLTVVQWFADGLRRRLDGLDLPIDDAVFRHAALWSGGVPRDAIRILRATLLASLGAKAVSMAAGLAGRREVRQDLEQALTVSERRAIAGKAWEPFERELIKKNAVLTYEGKERRYAALHPLLADARAGMGELV